MSTIIESKLNEHRLRAAIPAMFATTTSWIGELMQNARRSGATYVAFDIFGVDTGDGREEVNVHVYDDGCGIKDPAALIGLGISDWDNFTTLEEMPFGLGFLSAVASCKSTRIRSTFGSFTVNFDDIVGVRPIVVNPYEEMPKHLSLDDESETTDEHRVVNVSTIIELHGIISTEKTSASTTIDTLKREVIRNACGFGIYVGLLRAGVAERVHQGKALGREELLFRYKGITLLLKEGLAKLLAGETAGPCTETLFNKHSLYAPVFYQGLPCDVLPHNRRREGFTLPRAAARELRNYSINGVIAIHLSEAKLRFPDRSNVQNHEEVTAAIEECLDALAVSMIEAAVRNNDFDYLLYSLRECFVGTALYLSDELLIKLGLPKSIAAHCEALERYSFRYDYEGNWSNVYTDVEETDDTSVVISEEQLNSRVLPWSVLDLLRCSALGDVVVRALDELDFMYLPDARVQSGLFRHREPGAILKNSVIGDKIANTARRYGLYAAAPQTVKPTDDTDDNKGNDQVEAELPVMLSNIEKRIDGTDIIFSNVYFNLRVKNITKISEGAAAGITIAEKATFAMVDPGNPGEYLRTELTGGAYLVSLDDNDLLDVTDIFDRVSGQDVRWLHQHLLLIADEKYECMAACAREAASLNADITDDNEDVYGAAANDYVEDLLTSLRISLNESPTKIANDYLKRALPLALIAQLAKHSVSIDFSELYKEMTKGRW